MGEVFADLILGFVCDGFVSERILEQFFVNDGAVESYKNRNRCESYSDVDEYSFFSGNFCWGIGIYNSGGII